jgi:hypothetical protein
VRAAMLEEEAVPGTETAGGLTIERPDPNAPKPAVSEAIPRGLLLGYVDLAIRGTLEYERFSRIYVSPWWEVPNVPEGVWAWKRAVLERVPLQGANHWGHVYLIVDGRSEARSILGLRSRAPLQDAVTAGENDVRLPLREGVQRAELLVHPSHPERTERLLSFAQELETRFRRQMD